MTIQDPNTSLLTSAKGTASDKTPALLAGRSGDVSFAFKGVQPPSFLYVDVDDQLVLQAATSQTAEVITVNVRLLLPTGRLEDMQLFIRPANTRVVLRQSFSLAQGYILSVSAVAAIATTRGQTFLRIATQRSASGSGNPAQMLFSDYVTTQATSAYPNGRVLSPSEGPGLVYAVQVTNPAAGSDWSQNIPVNARWRVRSWSAAFTTSAAVANRNIEAVYTGTTGRLWVSSALASVAASTSQLVSAGGITAYTGVITTVTLLGLPPDLILTGSASLAMSISSNTLNIQGADQWSTISILVEEWLDNV